MHWLNYTNDEVSIYHKEFESAANEALIQIGLDNSLEWVHHIRTQGSMTIPDFVLREKVSKQWRLALEIKRTPNAVFSERYQIQAKGYAEVNDSYYVAAGPRYFAISNLEKTILFAINGGKPPRECRIQNGYWESGSFFSTPTNVQKAAFISNIIEIIRIIISKARIEFESVWPIYQQVFYSHSEALSYNTAIKIPEPNSSNWNLVRDYFAAPVETESKRIFLLRCLLAEYLRGILNRNNHSSAANIPPIKPNHLAVSNTINALGSIDFQLLFDSTSSKIYQDLSDQDLLQDLENYIRSLIHPPGIAQLANNRGDAPELIENLLSFLYPPKEQDERGKVQTDPELANLLVALGITKKVDSIVDPCCGDGPLLLAAYSRLKTLGADRNQALTSIQGIEADPIAARLAAVRLALLEPATIALSPPIQLFQGDMFANGMLISNADVILMNPPFKRYESQDIRPIPHSLREYYISQIKALGGEVITASGQPNLYNFYVEWVGKNMKEGARMAIILDNKWYHSRYGTKLREFLTKSLEINAILEYPHDSFFKNWMIATSILIATKRVQNPDHDIMFIRSKVDPRGADLQELTNAFNNSNKWPLDWTCRKVKQIDIDIKKGWKSYFSSELINDYRFPTWPTLSDLFMKSRRGGLQKEEGGIKVYEFPFTISNYGPKRLAKTKRRPFQTISGPQLTPIENQRLADLASRIPSEYRGYALHKADKISGYILNHKDVTLSETIEPPHLRSETVVHFFQHNSRTGWTQDHDIALNQLKSNREVNAYMLEVESTVGLTNTVLSKAELWLALREPYAGELIIPRKTREGHRVHINPFAINRTSRQVRISSNFISFSDCIAVNPSMGLNLDISIKLIAAFLISSFGQLQFEIEGYNREGLLSLEKHQLEKIRVFDPRWINPNNRQRILSAFTQVSYPISAKTLSYSQHERNALDDIFAEEIVSKHPEIDKNALLSELYQSLDEWLTSRNP